MTHFGAPDRLVGSYRSENGFGSFFDEDHGSVDGYLTSGMVGERGKLRIEG